MNRLSPTESMAAATRPPFAPVSHENLRIFGLLRLIPLAGMYFGAAYLFSTSGTTLHWPFIGGLLAALGLAIAFTWFRSFRQPTISPWEFFAHLTVDIAIYSLLMYNTGGAGNPFMSFLLVPVTVAAIALPATLTWLTGAICLSCYSLLLFWYIPLPMVSPAHGMTTGHHGQGINIHVLGMWLNFMVSALLIAYFINRMAATISRQEISLARQQQKRLEDDQLLAVATLAASAAHELGTPLNTMKLISDEWRDRPPGSNSDLFREDLAIFTTQIERCQLSLQKLSGRARKYATEGLACRNVREYLQELLDEWMLMRPDVKVEYTFANGDDEAEITYHPSLSASIHNLLNNAGDASPQKVQITANWDDDRVHLMIRDFGGGLQRNPMLQLPGESDKATGMGLGLYLARSILARHGASLELDGDLEGGTHVRIDLPLRQINE